MDTKPTYIAPQCRILPCLQASPLCTSDTLDQLYDDQITVTWEVNGLML